MRYAWIEGHRDKFSVTRMCKQLEVSRSGYGQWRGRAPSERARSNAVLDAAVATLHGVSRRSYGRPRIVQGLHKQGLRVGHERVRKSHMACGRSSPSPFLSPILRSDGRPYKTFPRFESSGIREMRQTPSSMRMRCP